MSTTPAPERSRPRPQPTDFALSRGLLAAWIGAGILLALLAVFWIRRGEEATEAEWRSRLSRLADDRLALAERALDDWKTQARLIGRQASVRQRLLARRTGSRSASETVLEARVREELDELAQDEAGLSVRLVDASGALVQSSSLSPVLTDVGLSAVRRALADRRTVIGRPADAAPDELTLQIAEPVADDTGAPAGAVVLTLDAAPAFGRYFLRATAGPREHLFLVVPDETGILVIAPEWQTDVGGTHREPPESAGASKTFAAASLRSPRTAGEFVDAAGRPVMAVSRSVPELPWAIVVEVDRAEAVGPRRQQALWILLATAALFGAITAVGLAWQRSVRLRHYEQLSDRDARYRALLEQTQEAVAVGLGGKVAYANPACLQMFAATLPMAGMPISTFFAPGSREQVDEIVQHRIQGRTTAELFEAVGLRSDGSTFDVEVRVSSTTFEGKSASQAILRDISGRKRMEAELRDSEERYRLLFERNLAGVYRSTLDGRMLECNRAFAQMMGYGSPAEVLAQPAAAFHADARARETFLEQLRREGSLLNYENVGRRKDGSGIWVIENVSLLRTEDGSPEILLGTVIDMTERRKLEEQLLQSQKMEAVGRLAGGIAHDFNNLLTAVSGYTELLIGQLAEGDPRRESAEEIRQAGHRAAALTQQLLAFSRRQVLEPRVLDLNAVISNMERMLRRVIGEDIELSTSLAGSLWRTKADPAQIEQAILNLVVNARDAMPRGGQLTLETANVDLDAKYSGGAPGPHVMLAVSDTGVGMDKEQQARLFEPFYTTKERGKGTGLGLSTTYGVVKQSGGSIWVYSERGLGTTFKIYLPRSEEPLDEPAEAPPPAIPLSGTETILLVEDEPEVRRLVQKILDMHGYAVLSAASPAEAIAISRSRPGTIDILVTDVIMPGMNGRELARALSTARPDLRVLYMSGYTDAAIAHQGILDPGTAFLSKPFTPDVLARKVREVLDSPTSNLKTS
jgi:two-component system cell cycle sensor histidine kinase/response regulator CckA